MYQEHHDTFHIGECIHLFEKLSKVSVSHCSTYVVNLKPSGTWIVITGIPHYGEIRRPSDTRTNSERVSKI